MNIDKKLLKEINEYCKLNNVVDIDGLINKMLKTGFDIEKYGPSMSVNKPKIEDKIEEVKEKPTTKKHTTKKITKTKVVKVEDVPKKVNKIEEDLYGE